MIRTTYPNLGAFAPDDHPARPALFRWARGLYCTDGHVVIGPCADEMEADLRVTMLLLARRRKYIYVLSRVVFALCALTAMVFLFESH